MSEIINGTYRVVGLNVPEVYVGATFGVTVGGDESEVGQVVLHRGVRDSTACLVKAVKKMEPEKLYAVVKEDTPVTCEECLELE